MISIGTRRADDRGDVDLTFTQMVLANRAYERQAGILKLMQEAGQCKREYLEAKAVFEAELEVFKKTRGEMSPEKAAEENLRLKGLLSKKTAARDRQHLATTIILSENRFLKLFGSDIGEREGETHSARKRRTRIQISRYFGDTLTCKYVTRNGEVLTQRPDGDDHFVVTEELQDIIRFLDDANAEKRTAPKTPDFVATPSATTVGILTGNEGVSNPDIHPPEDSIPPSVHVT